MNVRIWLKVRKMMTKEENENDFLCRRKIQFSPTRLLSYFLISFQAVSEQLILILYSCLSLYFLVLIQLIKMLLLFTFNNIFERS